MARVDLQQGANTALDAASVAIRLSLPTLPAGVEVDASAYLLTASGKVRSDADMLFYNQLEAAEGAVRLQRTGAGQDVRVAVELARLPAAIERVVVCTTIDAERSGGRTLALLDGAELLIADGTRELAVYRPSLAGATEAALILGELYRRGGGWKFRAVGQGFTGGLAPLARSFGIDVAEPVAPAGSFDRAPTSAAPEPAPVRLAKVSLEKPGQAVSLEKKGAAFGEISINLNWSRAKRGMFGAGNAIDLDLGCLFELADGRTGVVQALGKVFGALDRAPWIELSGDDRTGDVADGETLRINGAHWREIKRVCVFANIYDGVPNWQRTDGVVLVTIPDQPPIEVRLTEGRNDRRLCGVVMLDNDGGRLRATRLVEYFRDQEQLDRKHGFGLRWVAGSKD